MSLPIVIQGLSKVYRGKKGRPVQALDDLSLQIGNGEIFGFLGPNGAGKSTTIKALMGQIRATSGEAFLFGIPVSDAAARVRVGYLPENPSFYDFLTAREYLHMVGGLFRMEAAAIRQRAVEVLDLLALTEAADRAMRGYSKGMVQRLGLAQALLHDPDLYILDEPMSGLDPIGRSLVKQILVDLRARGKTVFFSTHVTADVEAVCDRVGILVGSRLRALKPVAEIMDRGIQGYQIQLFGQLPESVAHLENVPRSGGITEIFVPREQLNDFMARASTAGCAVRLIEPRRRDLEDFFLDIVSQG